MESKNQDYIKRLISCGISCSKAARIVCSFLKEFGEEELQSYIESLEKAPDDRMRQQIQRIVTKAEQMDD